MNMSPFGPLPQLTCGNLGLPKLGPAALGVSATKSLPLQSSVSPQMWLEIDLRRRGKVLVHPSFGLLHRVGGGSRTLRAHPITRVAVAQAASSRWAAPQTAIQGPFALNRVASFAIAVA